MTEPERLRELHIRNTDYAPFWWRLNELGFKRGIYRTKEYKIRGSPFVFIRTYFTFVNGTRDVELRISRHGTRLIIRRNKQVELRTRKMPSANWLERPFINYFGSNPLWLRSRIGRQSKTIRKWLSAQALKRAKHARKHGLRLPNHPLLNSPNYLAPPSHKSVRKKSNHKSLKC